MTCSVQGAAPAATVDSSTYQTFLAVRTDGDLVKRVEEQLEDWLRKKKNWDPPTEVNGFHRGPGKRELLVLHRLTKGGRDFRARLREPTKAGTWTTTVTVHAAGDDDSWIGLRVANSQGRFVDVPGLAAFLVDALEARDGDTWLSSTPRVIYAPGVEEFAEELTHIDRKGLYFVAGTASDLAFDKFRVDVTAWTRQTVGLAQVAVLDPAATAAFNEIMGPHHGTVPWTIRTYRPDVDPAISSDGRRHRILGTGRLAEEPEDAICRLLGRVARRYASEQPRPPRFVPVDQALTRLEDALLLDSLYAEPANEATPVATDTPPQVEPAVEPDSGVADAASAYLAQIELTNSALERVTRQLEERRQAIEELKVEAQYFRELNEEYELDLANAATEFTKVADENRWLRTRLRSLQDHETAAASLPTALATDYPAGFVELADRLERGNVGDVVFTGDLKQVRALEEHDPVGRIAQVAWDALLTLADYVRARNEDLCAHGVKHYLLHTPQGFRTLPPKKFAEKETGTTMKAWGGQREFPVPSNLNAGGTVAMEAHFKLGRVGMVSPRLYYLDDWVRTRKVYVGYIGSHLRNTQTN